MSHVRACFDPVRVEISASKYFADSGRRSRLQRPRSQQRQVRHPEPHRACCIGDPIYAALHRRSLLNHSGGAAYRCRPCALGVSAAAAGDFFRRRDDAESSFARGLLHLSHWQMACGQCDRGALAHGSGLRRLVRVPDPVGSWRQEEVADLSRSMAAVLRYKAFGSARPSD